MRSLTTSSNRLTRSTRPALGLASATEQPTPMQMAEQYGFERHQRAITCRLIQP